MLALHTRKKCEIEALSALEQMENEGNLMNNNSANEFNSNLLVSYLVDKINAAIASRLDAQR